MTIKFDRLGFNGGWIMELGVAYSGHSLIISLFKWYIRIDWR